MKDRREKILLLGKMPPPYYGTSFSMEVISKSRLFKDYRIIPFNVNVNHELNDIGSISTGKILRNFVLYVKLIASIIRHRPGLVHIPISQSSAGFIKDSVFILISRLCLRKVLLHLHGSNFLNWMKSTNAIVRRYAEAVLKLSGGVIVLGQSLVYLFEKHYPKDRIFVVPNGADFCFPRIPGHEEKVRILYLANLQHSKGITDIVDACKILSYEFGLSNYTLDVAGQWRDTPTEKYCREKQRSLDLPINFLGPAGRKEKYLLYAKAQAFVFTPRKPEGHPWVIVEAMAAGLPIVTTPMGAIPESVKNGMNGFLVQPENPGQIAMKLKALIESEELRDKMGKMSRRLYLESFTEEKMIWNLSRCYAEMMN